MKASSASLAQLFTRVLAAINSPLTKYEIIKATAPKPVVLVAVWATVNLCVSAAAFYLQSFMLFALGSLMLISPLLLIVFGNTASWIKKLLFRSSVTVKGREMPGDLYWEISSLLKARGITNVQKYIFEHPEHVVVMYELYDELCSASLTTRKSWTAAVALVFVSDHNPAAVRDSLLSILNERRIRSVDEVRELLISSISVASPLSVGVL